MCHTLFVIPWISQVKIGAKCNLIAPVESLVEPYYKRFKEEYFFVLWLNIVSMDCHQ